VLLDLAEGSHNATLFAPQRFGTTSLLNQLVDSPPDRDPGADEQSQVEALRRLAPGAWRRCAGRTL
jgi:hypothetical protein